MRFPARSASCWITTQDNLEALEECGGSSIDSRTLSCWIPSQTDQEFVIHWRIPNLFDSPLCADVFIDGQKCRARVSRRFQDIWNCAIGSMLTSASTEKPFRFSRIAFTDEDAYLTNQSISSEIGQIRIEFKEAEPTSTSDFSSYRPTFSPADKIHERSSKASVHHVGLGKERSRKALTTFRNVDCGEHVVTFIFNYRPFEMLKAMGKTSLISRHPSSTTSANGNQRAGSSNEVIDLTLDSDSDESDKPLKAEAEDSDAADAEEMDVLQRKMLDIHRRREARTSKKVKVKPGIKTESVDVKQEKL